MGKNVELIARGVIVDGSYTLLCRPRGENYCFLPGGHVEFFENSETALIREIKEELGLFLKIEKYLGTFETAFKTKKKHHELNVVFLMETKMKYSKKVKSMEDHVEFFWWPIDQLHKARFLPKELGKLLPQWIFAKNQNWASAIQK